MLAFRKAAWERQREESLLQARRKLAAELSSISDPEHAAIHLAKPLSTRFAGVHILLFSQNDFVVSFSSNRPTCFFASKVLA